MNGQALKVVQDLAAWRGFMEPLSPGGGLCACTPLMAGGKDTTLLVFLHDQKSRDVRKWVVSATIACSGTHLCL